MKKLLVLLLLLGTVEAQQYRGQQITQFLAVSTGNMINLTQAGVNYHNIIWTKTGTVSTCSVRVDSSADGITWNSGDVISAQTCTSNGSSSYLNFVASYIRVNVTTLSGGGTVYVTWTGYGANPQSSSGTVTTSGSPASPNLAAFSSSTAITSATAHNAAIPLACVDTSSSATTYACTTSPSFTPAAGDALIFSGINQNNSGSSTLNVNTAGAKTITKQQNAANLASGDLRASGAVVVVYDGTNWQIVGQIGNAGGGLPTGLTYASPTLTVSSAGNGSAILALSGNTSGTATFTAPAVAGTTTNPVVLSNALQVPALSLLSDANQMTLGASSDAGIKRDGVGRLRVTNGSTNFGGLIVDKLYTNNAGNTITSFYSNPDATPPTVSMSSTVPFGWTSSGTDGTSAEDTAISRLSAGIMGVGTGTQGSTAGSLELTAIATVKVLTTNLPTCTANTGVPWRASVSDATAPALGVALTGGGLIFANVHCSLTSGTYIVDGL